MGHRAGVSQFTYIEVVSPTRPQHKEGNDFHVNLNFVMLVQILSNIKVNKVVVVRVIGRLEKWGFHGLICSLCPVRLLW